MEKVKQDYRWMTKVAIHLLDSVDDFIIQYQIPKEDIKTVKKLWDNAVQDWKNFENFASTPACKKVRVTKKCVNRKIQTCKINATVKEEHHVGQEEKQLQRCRNAKILNRINQYNFQQEEEEDLINKYIDELNYQKAKKLSDLISFYEEEELSITPSLSVA